MKRRAERAKESAESDDQVPQHPNCLCTVETKFKSQSFSEMYDQYAKDFLMLKDCALAEIGGKWMQVHANPCTCEPKLFREHPVSTKRPKAKKPAKKTAKTTKASK